MSCRISVLYVIITQYIIIGGDADFMRSNDATCVLKNFLKQETLKCGLLKDGVNIEYTY